MDFNSTPPMQAPAPKGAGDPTPSPAGRSVQAENGMFYIVDANGNRVAVDLGTVLMMLQLDRTAVADRQIADMLGEINDRNTVLKTMTELMAKLRDLKSKGSGDASVTINGKTQNASTWMVELGLTWTNVPTGDKNQRDAAWDANIQTIKGRVDMLNNDSQMANIRLQNLVEKRNNAFEMASKVMATNNQSIQSTIRNL